MRCLPGEEYADLEIAATAALHLDDDDDDDDDDDVYIEDCKGERKCVFCEKGSSTLFIAIGKGGTFRSFIL